MTIDEAIEQFKYDAECNRADLDLSFAEDKDKVAEWLEELKAYRNHVFSGEMTQSMLKEERNKAIDDFVKFASDMPTVDEEDGTIRPMWLEEMAEKLKVGVNNEYRSRKVCRLSN